MADYVCVLGFIGIFVWHSIYGFRYYHYEFLYLSDTSLLQSPPFVWGWLLWGALNCVSPLHVEINIIGIAILGAIQSLVFSFVIKFVGVMLARTDPVDFQ